jgi:hypothetical protein
VANNVYVPNGFQAARLWTGSVPNYAINDRAMAYNYGTQIARYDPVFLNTSGNVVLYAVGGTTIDGIAVGFNFFDPNNISSGAFHQYWNAPTLPTGTNVITKIVTDPNMVFIAQANGVALTQASVGLNIDIFTGSSGTPQTGSGLSQCALDAGNVHNTNTLPFRIVGIVGLTPGFGSEGYNVPNGYVATNGNQYLAVTMNTQDMTTRTGQS